MIRALRALPVLLPMSTGCTDWPRFSHLPPADAAPVGLPDELTLKKVLSEPSGTGWADTPNLMAADTEATLGALWEVTRLDGVLAPLGADGGSISPFHDLCENDLQVGYTEGSDIDWVHLLSDGGPLCLLLESDPSTEIWDVVLYAYDPGAGCVVGPFLNNAADEGIPDYLVPGVGTFVAEVPAGPLALYVAGAGGGPLVGDDVPYSLHVVPATVLETCQALQASDLTDLVEAP